jgi:hypothetical protein
MAFASLCASRNSTAPHGGALRSHFPLRQIRSRHDSRISIRRHGARLREESVLFRSVPTAGDKIQRAALLLHETAHQWFGDLVAMRWFDDPWLKEGFAQYMAYEILATLYPPGDIWKGFYQSFKPAAYTMDSTHGTAPIHQSIANLKEARSAYGAIVYSKTPGILRQLSFDAQRAASPELEAMLESRMQSAPDLSLRILYCRSFRSIATTPAALARLKSLLAGQSSVPGLEIKPRDRWTMLAALLAHADPDASALLHAEQQRDSIGDGRKYAYAAGAARPDAAVKQQYFKDYLENRALQEDWIEQRLAAFNYWTQSALTQPNLDSALASLPQNQARPQDLLHACLAERLHRWAGDSRCRERSPPVAAGALARCRSRTQGAGSFGRTRPHRPHPRAVQFVAGGLVTRR